VFSPQFKKRTSNVSRLALSLQVFANQHSMANDPMTNDGNDESLTFALMRTLFLVRHAKSSWDNPGLRDFNRPLNERGLRDAPQMAQMLVRQGIKPDLLVSSPAKRALTTALFFAETFGIADEAVQREQDIYEAAPSDILHIVNHLPDSARAVLLFGHNPTLTEVANRFSEKFIDNVPTCGIVQIESSADSWKVFGERNAAVKECFFPKEVL